MVSRMSQRSSHTHCQAPHAQAQTKACQRVCLPQPEKNFKISLPLFKEKIKTLQRTTNPDKKGINVSIDKFNMKVQFDSNTRTDKNSQCITRYIKNWADTTGINGCSSLQTLYRVDSDVLRSAQLFIYRNRYTA